MGMAQVTTQIPTMITTVTTTRMRLTAVLILWMRMILQRITMVTVCQMLTTMMMTTTV